MILPLDLPLWFVTNSSVLSYNSVFHDKIVLLCNAIYDCSCKSRNAPKQNHHYTFLTYMIYIYDIYHIYVRNV